jgi:dCMP deaminase
VIEERISRDEMLMHFARIAGLRSTCLRAQVGAVIAQSGRIVSVGYNGAPSGMAHCSESNGCGLNTLGCTRAVHAEANAVAFAAKRGISTEGASLYTTLGICLPCSQLLINCGIQEIVYKSLYRDPSGLKLLEEVGVLVRQF